MSTKFTIDGYAQLELNNVAFRRDGRIEAQCKLSADGGARQSEHHRKGRQLQGDIARFAVTDGGKRRAHAGAQLVGADGRVHRKAG